AFLVWTVSGRPAPTPFPYTTLFRSRGGDGLHRAAAAVPRRARQGGALCVQRRGAGTDRPAALAERQGRGPQPEHSALQGVGRDRSEEHTSELQSRENLVCRLLLEKK